MIHGFLARMGDSDCEAIESGFLAQPVNAVSSLAYTVVGVAVLVWAQRAKGHERTARYVFGVAMAATGIGSFLFHGPQGPVSQFLHDITFLSVLWLFVVLNVVAAGRVPASRGWWVYGMGVGAFAAALFVAPDVTNVLMFASVVALGVSEVGLGRAAPHRTLWWVASLVVILLAGVSFAVGRTGSPLCDPQSILQGHALWHLLGAAALAAYFVATSRLRAEHWRNTEDG